MPKNNIMNQSQIAQLGARINEERKRKGITLKELSNLVGLSSSYLSQIENGHVNININNLEAIANAFEIPLINLFVNGNKSDVSVIRKTEKRWLPLGKDAYESLLIKYRGNFEIFSIWLKPYSSTIKDSSHDGEEFTYIVRGKARVVLNGEDYHDLSEGDGIYYKSQIPHHWENQSDEDTEVLVINTPATY